MIAAGSTGCTFGAAGRHHLGEHPAGGCGSPVGAGPPPVSTPESAAATNLVQNLRRSLATVLVGTGATVAVGGTSAIQLDEQRGIATGMSVATCSGPGCGRRAFVIPFADQRTGFVHELSEPDRLQPPAPDPRRRAIARPTAHHAYQTAEFSA